MRSLPVVIVAAAIAALVVPAAHAQQQQAGPLTAFDVMTSTVMQEGQSSFSGLAARARIHPSRLIEGVEILPSIEYWRNSSSVTPYDIRASRKDATMGADARYNFKIGSWNPYVGGGYAIHFLSSKVNAPAFGLNDATDSLVKGGLTALAGTTFELTPKIDNFIELKYHHITDYRQLKINWGLGFKL